MQFELWEISSYEQKKRNLFLESGHWCGLKFV